MPVCFRKWLIICICARTVTQHLTQPREGLEQHLLFPLSLFGPAFFILANERIFLCILCLSTCFLSVSFHSLLLFASFLHYVSSKNVLHTSLIFPVAALCEASVALECHMLQEDCVSVLSWADWNHCVTSPELQVMWGRPSLHCGSTTVISCTECKVAVHTLPATGFCGKSVNLWFWLWHIVNRWSWSLLRKGFCQCFTVHYSKSNWIYLSAEYKTT